MPPKLIYWDSCIFIAWLKDERRPPGEMDGVYECVELVESNQVRLITSTLTRTEVFEAELTPEVRSRYSLLLNRRNVQQVDADLRITDLARQIREHYHALGDGKKGISQADAVHLATAIHLKAHAFYTFDDGGKGARSLLSLDGDVAGHPLRICKPEVTQFRLPFGAS